MSGVVGAADGLFLRTKAPSSTQTLKQIAYYSGQKKGYGYNVQAVATAKYRFSGLSVMNPGATNDYSAWIRSSLWDATQCLPPGYYIVGDAAYPLSDQLLTPYPGRNLEEEFDVFNFHLSQLRIKVEQAFGILVGTWGIFWRPLAVQFEGRADLITAVFHLHNFLRDEGVQPIRPAEEDSEGRLARPRLSSSRTLPRSFETERRQAPRRTGDPLTRVALRKTMAHLGLKRPAHNVARNSNVQ